MTWSLSSVNRRRRQPACNMSGQIRLILALPWRNNRRIDEILTQLEIASLPLEVTFWRQPVDISGNARGTVVSEATKSAASDTVDLANKRQKVPALVNVVATPVWTSHSERPCSATMIRLRSLTAGGRNLAEH